MVHRDFFLCIGEQRIRGADGLITAVDEALTSVVGDLGIIYKKTLICMYRRNVQQHWRKTEFMNSSGSSMQGCSFRKNTTESEVGKVLSILSGISSYFHTSSIRTSDLKKITSDRGMKLLSIPKLFEISL